MQTEYREVAWVLRWFPIPSNRRSESRLAKWRTLSSGIGQRSMTRDLVTAPYGGITT